MNIKKNLLISDVSQSSISKLEAYMTSEYSKKYSIYKKLELVKTNFNKNKKTKFLM